MTRPAPLSQGDIVRIVPTARAITESELTDGIELLRSWGLTVQLATNVGAKQNQLAGSDEERAEALKAAFLDDSVRCIWCARGGYGTVRVLEKIPPEIITQNPKWVVGFSDITALHNYMNQLGIMSIHAQMPFAINKKTEATHQTLRQALFGEQLLIESTGHGYSKAGQAYGELVGGNLSVLYSLRGSAYDLVVQDKILFLEDLDELYYHLDRMAQNLKASGWNKKIAGLVVGGMTAMWDKNPEDPFGASSEQILLDALGTADIPVAFGFPVGHSANNQALLLGQKVKLSVSNKGAQLSFENSSA